MQIPLKDRLNLAKRYDYLAVFLVAVVVYSCSVDYVLRGDPAMYADYVLLGKFDELTIHFGYYVFVYLVNQVIGEPLGIPLHHLMVHINVVVGSVALIVVYRLALMLLGGRISAFVCVIAVGLSERYLSNSTTIEIYAIQVALTWMAFDAFVRDRIFLAGVLAGLSLYITPLGIFGFLFFPVFDYLLHGRIRWSIVLGLALVGAVTYAPLIVTSYDELLWGRRGLLSFNADAPFSPVEAVVNLAVYLVKHYTFLLFLFFVGLTKIRKNAILFFCSVAVLLPHLYVALRLPGENGVFLSVLDFFIGCWIAVGFGVLFRSAGGKVFVPVVVMGHIAILVLSRAIFTFQPNDEYGEQMHAFVEEHVLGRDLIVLADWDLTMTLTYFGREQATSTIEKDALFGKMVNIDLGAMYSKKPVPEAGYLVVDSWSPGKIAALLRTEKQLLAEYEERSVKGRAERVLGLKCSPLASKPYPSYQCFPKLAVSKQ